MKRPQSTKRTLLVLMLFIVAGAIINVVVAWGLTFINPITQGTNEYARDFPPYMIEKSKNPPNQLDYTHWAVEVRSTFGGCHVSSGWTKGALRGSFSYTKKKPQVLVQYWCQFIRPNAGDGSITSRSVETRATGWPMLAQYSISMRDESAVAPLRETVQGLLIGHYSTKWGTINKRYLPVVPIWPGFAINTIFYAGILWLLFTAPGFVRRRIRVMRRHCPACNYPVGTWGTPVCTECGTPLTPSPLQGEGGGVGRSPDNTHAPNPTVYPPPNPLPAREGGS